MRHNVFPNSDTYNAQIPGWQVVMTVNHKPDGDTITLYCLGDVANEVEPDARPSLLGIAGYDDLWEPGDMLAHDVPPSRTRALVAALEAAETGAATVSPTLTRPETYWG